MYSVQKDKLRERECKTYVIIFEIYFINGNKYSGIIIKKVIDFFTSFY